MGLRMWTKTNFQGSSIGNVKVSQHNARSCKTISQLSEELPLSAHVNDVFEQLAVEVSTGEASVQTAGNLQPSESPAPRHIYVLLTRYSDTLSKAVSGLSWGYYSHVSIGFDPSFETFFSFTIKGFRIETPARICKKKKNVPCVLYSLPVSESMHEAMLTYVENYRATTNEWKFNLIGLACGIFHVPFIERKNHRFCSQFVSEVLEEGAQIKLQKKRSKMLPKDFLKVPELNLEFKGTLTDLVENVATIPAMPLPSPSVAMAKA